MHERGEVQLLDRAWYRETDPNVSAPRDRLPQLVEMEEQNCDYSHNILHAIYFLICQNTTIKN